MHMPSDYVKCLDETDELIKAGRLEQAQQALSQVPYLETPKKLLARMGATFRRLDQHEKALKCLKEQAEIGSDVDILMEYCRNLQALGINSEPLLRLAPFDQARMTDALFVKAQSLASSWNYRRLVTTLNQVLINEDDTYKRIIAHINICSAILFMDEIEMGTSYARDIVSLCGENGYDLLESHALELYAQGLIYQSKIDEADKAIQESLGKLKAKESRTWYNKEKWRRVIEFQKTSRPEDLLQLQVESEKNGLFEIVRSIDFEIARKAPNDELVLKLYYGTPSADFKNLITRLFGCPQKGLVLPGAHSEVLELSSGMYNGTAIFGGNRKVLSLVQSLVKDLYRPMRIGSLFSAIYPGEIFEPVNSIAKVRRVLGRARKVLDEYDTGIQIVEANHLYRIDNSGGCTISWGKETLVQDSVLEKMRSKFGNDTFRVQDAQEHFGCARSSAVRRLKKLVDEGKLFTFGAGRATVYYFSS